MAFVDLPHMRLSYSSMGFGPPIVFLHGIMGNKNNLEHFVRKLLETLPKAQALIFDLRNHGDSSKNLPCLVEACADDIAMACQRLGIEPLCVYGHSFGGKVALLCAKKLPNLKQVWLLDCAPGIAVQKPLKPDSPSAFEIIDKLRKVQFPCANRNDLVKELLNLEVPRGLALWMTTNLKEEEGKFFLTFSPDEVEAMLKDFINLDLWPEVSKVSMHTEVHLLAAEHGDRITSEDKKRWLLDAKPSMGFVHELKDSGHFVHADNPKGLIEIICEHWPVAI